MIGTFSVLLTLAATQPASAPGLSLFYGLRGCLAIAAGETLAEGDGLIVLTSDMSAREARAGAIRTPSAGSPCWREFDEDQPVRVSSLSLPGSWQDEVLFAVRPLPNLLIVSGPAVRLSAAEAERWAREISPSQPAEWRVPQALVHAYGYGGKDGAPRAIELYLGLPTWHARGGSPPIASVRIRRFFFINGRLLASEQYERASGREERAESEPPSLTAENWSASETARTVAFLSPNAGQSWQRLSTDIGFEGIWWIAEALQPGLPRTFEKYLYTRH